MPSKRCQKVGGWVTQLKERKKTPKVAGVYQIFLGPGTALIVFRCAHTPETHSLRVHGELQHSQSKLRHY